MDQSCFDLEFFDFKDLSEDEVKEIQAILKGPESRGCVELPWEIPAKESSLSSAVFQNEGNLYEKEVNAKGDKNVDAVVGQAVQFASAPSPSVARLPPVEAFVAPPTTISPYANTPYFVSRTLPFVRAYPHMGMPFFACPIPGTNEANAIPSPYGQFVPMVPATVGQEKFIGQADCEPVQKNKASNDRQFNRHYKKKLTNSEYSFESESSEMFNDPATTEEQTPISSPVSTVSGDHSTSVPLVPLSVPPSTFGVAGSTLSLHGYPPGLHALPYTQMSGPQAPSAAMYYVPVFNHPYGSFIQPPSAPMVLPVNIRPSNESAENCSEEAFKAPTLQILPPTVTKAEENSQNIASNIEVKEIALECCTPCSEAKEVNSTAKNTGSEVEVVSDCNSSPDQLISCTSMNSSTDCVPQKVSNASEDNCECPSGDLDNKTASRDASRCWADLFKKPSSEVNGIDQQLAVDQGFSSLSNLNKEVSNGKLYTVPASDTVL